MFKKIEIEEKYLEYLLEKTHWFGFDPEILINNNTKNEKLPRLVCHNNDYKLLAEYMYDKVYGIEIVVLNDLKPEIELFRREGLKEQYLKSFQLNIGPIFFILVIEGEHKENTIINFICLIPFQDVVEYLKINKIYNPAKLPLKFFDDYTIYDFEKDMKFENQKTDILNEIYKQIGSKEKNRE